MIKKIFDYLILKGKTISFAESCSGGNLSLSITKIAGASKVFKGSIVSYSTYSKEKVIGIGRNEIDSFSPVSQEIAVKMAEKVNLSSLGRSEQSSLEIFSGNIGFTRSGKYTDVARL